MHRILSLLMTLMLCLTVLHTGETMAHGVAEAMEHHHADGQGDKQADHGRQVEAAETGPHADWLHHAHDATGHLLVVVPAISDLVKPPIQRGHVRLPAYFTHQSAYIRIDRPPRAA